MLLTPRIVAEEESVDAQSQTSCSTPVQMLEAEYARVMQVSAEELDLEPAVYLREGSDLMAQLRDQLIMLPESEELTPECNIDEATVGVPRVTTPDMEAKMRRIPKRHSSIFLGDGNAAPAPVRGVVCDIDVGEVKPVVLRARQIPAPFLVKVFEFLKKLFEAEIIEHSESEWSSPIVIVLKKNGVDIRMCIDYRFMNLLIKLSRYPLPLINDRLVDFESAMSRLCMAERGKLISALVCPFGHLQWLRMPLGLKNAPLIYQSVINNCVWRFVRLPPEEEAMVDPEVLEFLNLKSQEALKPEVNMEDSEVPSLKMPVFRRNIPDPSQMGPVLGRSSYIDDIAHGASTWDQLCEDLAALLYRLRYWNISFAKIEFGKLSIPFLFHEVSADGIRALPTIVKGIQDLPFPATLNYYNKFTEHLPVVAAVLYELDKNVYVLDRTGSHEGVLKRKIVSTLLLRHPDRGNPFVIIPHANPWAACAVMGQEYEELIHPVALTGRKLKESEPLIYDSEFPVVVYTHYPVLKWLLESNTADGRHLMWGLELSRWTLGIHRTQKDEDGLDAILGSGITPREHLDKVAETLIPAKGRLKVMPSVSLEMLDANYQGYVLSFYGAAKVSTCRGSCGCILCKLPGWQVMKAERHIVEGVTVNDAGYHGLIIGLKLTLKFEVKELVANFASVKLIHVKREFNQAADYLTSKTLVLEESWELNDPDEIVHLPLVSRIPEMIMKPSEISDTSATDAVHTDQVELEMRNPDVRIPESSAAAAEALMVMTRTRAGVDTESRTSVDRSGYQDGR
ncbi:LOW QUALITY PROTEIN: reverse transcriptase [Phytophthora megakarya]|uniref:Reverse transcriptase n=1 Tax=Phytophthora megakarya TaxID=4795 RepID=A0A225W433_9STRA|nr:LOW QUALITY PROTEIN: reverse transcriptase [Phytophthora megakarya]